MNPLVAEVTAFIGDESHGSGMIVTVESRQESEIHQGLKPIANAQDEAAPINEVKDLVAQTGLQTHCLNDPSTVIIPPAEASDKDQDLVILQPDRPLDQRIDVGAAGSCTGPFKRMGRLGVTV
jgi:hypothetical protein